MEISPGLSSQMTAQLLALLGPFFIDIYSGTPPASADLAPTGTLLGTVCANGIDGAALHFLANGSLLVKASEPWIVKGIADGTAGWFRLRQQSEDGTSTSLSHLRIDGTIGTADAPGDMTWDTLSVLTGQPFTIDQFIYSIIPV